MKFAVCIPTRGRPQLLATVVMALAKLSSGEHRIDYIIGYDDDDAVTGEMLELLKPHVALHAVIFDNSYITLGQRWNALAATVEADVYMTMTDDSIPLTPQWDAIAAAEIASREVAGWTDNTFMGELGNGFISRAWYQACGYLCIDHFPFWFADTWLKETYQFAFNRDVYISPNLRLGGERGVTTNMRELDFWWGFFHATRLLRLREAGRISTAFGTPCDLPQLATTRRAWIDVGIARDLDFRVNRIAQLEKGMCEKKPPSTRYIQARQRAEKLLADAGLSLWQELTV